MPESARSRSQSSGSIRFGRMVSHELQRNSSKTAAGGDGRGPHPAYIGITMRTAIVHYWLLNRRGGENVVDALCRLLPGADIYTLFCDPATLSSAMRAHHITTSFLNPLRRYYRSLLPLMPMALESFDLRGYDLVVSSESGPAKGVITSSHTRHICYCHTPMRYLWDLYPAYRNEWTRSRWKRALMTPVANYLRLWDYAAAARVDRFAANSRNVQRSEEHTSELQSLRHLVCRLLLEKKIVLLARYSFPRAPRRFSRFPSRRAQDGIFFFNHGETPGPSPLPPRAALPI